MLPHISIAEAQWARIEVKVISKERIKIEARVKSNESESDNASESDPLARAASSKTLKNNR